MDGELFRDIEVHPLAALFPMMSDVELWDLAADIKANGLLHPIVRSVDGRVLIDGRNRYAACGMAGVTPAYDDRIASEAEARALIVSANIQRRNITKSQQAMMLAMIYPEPEKGGRGEKRLRGANLDFDQSRLSRARTILRAAPDDLVPQVLAGTLSLDAAMAEVQKRLREADSDTARMARLVQDAPDLAELVGEDRMKISEAIAALDQRAAEAREIEANRREAWIRATDHAYRGALNWANPNFVDGIDARINDPAFRADFDKRVGFDPEQLANVIEGAERLVQFLRSIIP